ncbi:MAG: hypothetical protein AAF719_08880 [Pseudomonadota bacterium]
MNPITFTASFTALLFATACQTAPVETAAQLKAATSASVENAEADAQIASADAPRRNLGGHSKVRFVERYDDDGDGAVAIEEFMAAREAGYNDRDFNGDGAVHVDEYVSEYEARLEQELAEQHERQVKQAHVRFGFLDSDDDEVMTLEEFHASGDRMFTRLDTNGDGVVNDEDTAESF